MDDKTIRGLKYAKTYYIQCEKCQRLVDYEPNNGSYYSCPFCEPLSMFFQSILAIADFATASGSVYTKEALKELAAKEPDRYNFDPDTNIIYAKYELNIADITASPEYVSMECKIDK